jgi:hypothetical protein
MKITKAELQHQNDLLTLRCLHLAATLQQLSGIKLDRPIQFYISNAVATDDRFVRDLKKTKHEIFGLQK